MLEPVKRNMKISEAIRRGCELTPDQAIGTMVEYDPEPVKTCSIGAAYAGLFVEDGENVVQVVSEVNDLYRTRVVDAFNQNTVNVFEKGIPEPGEASEKILLSVFMIAANDEYEWSREQIADYLEEHGF